MELMHILFITDNFPPEVNAPASRTFEHCRSWVALGAKVTVITCAPNFPSGKVFKGYKNRFWQSQMMDGIHVIRVWSFIASNQGFMLRILDFISFMVSAIIAAMFVRKVNVIVGTSPQLFTACASSIVGYFKKIPWVFEVRDIWPESIKTVGVMSDSLIIRLLEKLELVLYRHAACIVTVTYGFKTILANRGIDDNKIKVVTNGVDRDRFIPREKDLGLISKLGLEDKFVVGYIGTHGLAHSLETLLDVAQYIQNRADGKNIYFLFIGNGAKKSELVSSAQAMHLTNISFLDSVSKSEVTRYWSLLDVAIIHLRKAKLFDSVIPSKLFECMGMGIPVLHGVPGESARIVLTERVGEVFESGNAAQAAELLLALNSDLTKMNIYRKNCLTASKNYCRNNLARKMLLILNGLVIK